MGVSVRREQRKKAEGGECGGGLHTVARAWVGPNAFDVLTPQASPRDQGLPTGAAVADYGFPTGTAVAL